jgi:hypothetical protein
LFNSTGSYNVGIGFESLYYNDIAEFNSSIGYKSLKFNTTGSFNVAVGNFALYNNTTSTRNTAVGGYSLDDNTTGTGNSAIGYETESGNFSNSVILGRSATATASNQFVVGSTTYNAGAIATETITPNKTWTVRINGANYKIPLLAI